MPFILNPVQQKFERERSGKDIILKARQEGFSSYIDADQLIECFRKPTNAVVISHEKEATKRLFARVKYFIDNLEIKPQVRYETKQDIFFEKINSNYYIGTAGQKAFGRGDTIHTAHLSEVAFWQKPETIIAGITEAVPLTGRITIESSPNGRGTWQYDEWQKAKAGESIYKPHFYPWFIYNEYRLTDNDLIILNIPGTASAIINNPVLSETEKNLKLTFEQIRWRRYKIWDLGELFYQEYPENDVDCFLQSGRPVFRVVNMTGREDLKVDREYIAGLDGAEGIQGGDNHSFAVIDHKSKPAKVVYEITNNKPIDIFDTEVANICHKFKIKLAVEKNGVGKAHCVKLKELKVKFTEWETTSATRPVMIVELEEAYRKDELRESYLEAKNELLDMYYDDKNHPTHRENKHDDRVFARAIAWQIRKQPEYNIKFI